MTKAPLYNLKAEKISDVTLPKGIFDVEVNDDLIAKSVRSYLANRRTAHAKVLDRGAVAGTTKKMYAQKGTGRARHSTAKVGIFVGGGSVHGPQGNQTFALKLNQKTKKLALYSLFTKFAKAGQIIVVDDFKSLEPKTKVAWNFMELLEKQNQDLAKSKKIGIITEAENSNVIRAFRNIAGLNLLSLNSLNVLDLGKQNFLIFSQNALAALK
jgi:large subunit ribosomal protein L4